MTKEKDDDPKPRRHSVPMYGPEYQWWTDAVRRQLAAAGIDQKRMSAEIGAKESVVSRCITREIPTYELLIQISDYLKIAHPVVLPESEAEALVLAEHKRAQRRLSKARKIPAGVPENANKDQMSPITSVHAVKAKRPKVGSKRPPRRTQQEST